MKRLVSLVFLLIVLLGGIGTTLYKHRPVSPVNTAVRPDVDLAFAVLGDVHENIDSLQAAINDYYAINPFMDALVLNGDTVDQGIPKQYDSLKKILANNAAKLPKTLIKNIGNHEFFNYEIEVNSPEDVQAFMNRYLEFAGVDKVYHDTWINGYHFISLGSEDGNSKTLDSIKAFISEQQQNWLKEMLGEKYEKGKPIFVFLHQPLNNSRGWGVVQSEEIKHLLSKYPEVILFTSHSHRQLDNSSVILDQPYTMVHTGAVHYTIVPDPNNQGKSTREPLIKGLYLEVKGNNVVIKGRDIKEKAWIFEREIFKG